MRDILAGKTPKDVDLSSECTPQDLMILCKRHGVKCIPTGLDHGTVSVRLSRGGELYEVTTLRVDPPNHTGRFADVEWTGDWRQDASRRDLTINAMSMDLHGNLFDYFGGLEDLRAGNIVFVGNANARIQEDYLRILRFFRFHARFNHDNSYCNETIEAIRENAVGLEGISGERKNDELSKLFRTPNGVEEFMKIYEIGVWRFVGLPGNQLLSVRI